MKYENIQLTETTVTHWATSASYTKITEEIKTLNLRNQGLTTFRVTVEYQHLTKLDLSKNAFSELVFDLDMPELEFLDLSYNQVPLTKVVFSGNFPKLKYLYIYESQLKAIVFEKAMPELEILTLSKNPLSNFDLPNGFDDLVALRLDDNQLSNFEVNPYNFGDLEYLNLQNNPFNENSLIQGYANNSENCLQAIIEYFDQKEVHDVGFDNECKVLLIGEGNVGKSCFVERLTEDNFKEEWDSTHAIAIKQYPIDKYILNLWDFGGQDIYHSTHRLFMSSNALYLLFWDKVTEANEFTPCLVEDGEERTYKVHKIPYWLNYTKSLGKGSPCIVVQTKTEKHGEADIPNKAKIRKQFKDIIVPRNGFKSIESKDDNWEENGYEDLLTVIKRSVGKLKKGSQLLTNCIAIRQALRDAQQAKRKLMPFEEYATIANQNDISNDGEINPMSLLKTWLVRTGVVYYREGLMNNQIILNQGWAIEAIYKLFDRKQHYYRLSRKKKGRITGKDLINIWSPTFDEHEQKLFIDFMLSCELCFETTPEQKEEERYKTVELAERSFIVPQLLTEERPDEQIEDFLEGRESWFVKYEHDFWHYGIMQSFIVRAKDLAKERAIWQIGILLKDGKSRALVEAVGENVIVRVTRDGKHLLDKIRNELNDINQDNQDTIRESVSLDGVSYVSLKNIKQCDRRNLTIPSENGKNVDLQALLLFVDTDTSKRFKKSTLENERGFVFEKPAEVPQKPIIRTKPTPSKPHTTGVHKILYLAANPNDSTRLQVDKEHRQIKTEMLKGQHRDNFEFLPPEFAVTTDALQRAFDQEPYIIHFSGHGSTKGIVITNSENNSVTIKTRALKRLFKRVKNTTKIVLLNSCYSAEQAKVISEFEIYVIGNNAPIGDKAAIAFAKGLYTGLSEGKSFEKSFDFAMFELENADENYAGVIEVWKDGKLLDLD